MPQRTAHSRRPYTGKTVPLDLQHLPLPRLDLSKGLLEQALWHSGFGLAWLGSAFGALLFIGRYVLEMLSGHYTPSGDPVLWLVITPLTLLTSGGLLGLVAGAFIGLGLGVLLWALFWSLGLLLNPRFDFAGYRWLAQPLGALLGLLLAVGVLYRWDLLQDFVAALGGRPFTLLAGLLVGGYSWHIGGKLVAWYEREVRRQLGW